jgi:hypothetical protein
MEKKNGVVLYEGGAVCSRRGRDAYELYVCAEAAVDQPC